MKNLNLDMAGHDRLAQMGADILAKLSNYYISQTKSKTSEDFVGLVINGVIEQELGGEGYLKQYISQAKVPSPHGLKFSSMIVSCAYCVEALEKIKTDRELAWLQMAEANYWCGVTEANKGIETLYREVAADAKAFTKKEQATKGARARAENMYGKAKEELYRLVREKVPVSGWKSRRDAASQLKIMVLTFAESQGVRISHEQALTTFSEWLKKMPDSENLFNTSRKK